MQIIFDKYTGDIKHLIGDDQNPDIYFHHYSDEFKASISILHSDTSPMDLTNYKIINNEIITRSDIEIQEINQYGKILTEEERLNILLQPTWKEVQKAENTIEMLSMLQEVGLI